MKEASTAKQIIIEEEIRVIESESIIEAEIPIPVTIQELFVAKENGKGQNPANMHKFSFTLFNTKRWWKFECFFLYRVGGNPFFLFSNIIVLVNCSPSWNFETAKKFFESLVM
jgi:hypothetical protein